MARGTIRRIERAAGIRYEAVVDLGSDPITGKRRQRSRTYRSKKEANVGMTRWLAEIDGGGAVDRSRATMAQHLRYWLETYARPNLSAKTLEMYEHIIERHIIPDLGAIPLQKLTPDQVQSFYAKKQADGCGARTIQLCHLRLSQSLKQAMMMGLVPRNVADFVKAPRAPAREMQTWTADEARAYLEVAADSHFGPVWLVSLATGMRRGELLGLRWQDVDCERRILSVRKTIGVVKGKLEIKKPKTPRSIRDIAVQPAVVEALRAHRLAQNERRLALGAAWEDFGLVFCASNGRPIHPENLSREHKRFVKLASVPLIRIHDQRHTHVTLAIAAGADVGAVSRRVGHVRTSITTDIYQHIMPEQHLDVADRIDAVLLSPRPKKPLKSDFLGQA